MNSWSGSLVIGVTECDPMHIEFPACASKLQNGSWVSFFFSSKFQGVLMKLRYRVDHGRELHFERWDIAGGALRDGFR